MQIIGAIQIGTIQIGAIGRTMQIRTVPVKAQVREQRW